jgi:hypothetical protein
LKPNGFFANFSSISLVQSLAHLNHLKQNKQNKYITIQQRTSAMDYISAAIGYLQLPVTTCDKWQFEKAWRSPAT